MPRYIDAEPFEGMIIVKPIVVEIDLGKYCKPGHFTQQDFVKMAGIDNIPAANVQEVRHGKWEYDQNIFPCFCSECGQEADMIYAFCPHCGAKMEVSDEK